jgi:hypothetical protein
MPPVWFWIVMLFACGVMWYFGVYRFNKWLKKDHEEFVELLCDNLELSNRMSKVRAFERCGKEL